MRGVKKSLVLIAAFLFLSVPAFAVDYVTVIGKNSTNLSTTIAVTNTFQSVQTSNGSRFGCFIQNPNASGGNSMWVFFGPIASATKATAVLLQPGVAVNCQSNSNVLTDQVSITGTSGDSFTANFQ